MSEQVYQDNEDLVGEWFKSRGKRDEVSRYVLQDLSRFSQDFE